MIIIYNQAVIYNHAFLASCYNLLLAALLRVEVEVIGVLNVSIAKRILRTLRGRHHSTIHYSQTLSIFALSWTLREYHLSYHILMDTASTRVTRVFGY
jgi:hypothetical protein